MQVLVKLVWHSCFYKHFLIHILTCLERFVESNEKLPLIGIKVCTLAWVVFDSVNS